MRIRDGDGVGASDSTRGCHWLRGNGVAEWQRGGGRGNEGERCLGAATGKERRRTTKVVALGTLVVVRMVVVATTMVPTVKSGGGGRKVVVVKARVANATGARDAIAMQSIDRGAVHAHAWTRVVKATVPE